ncbi:hypothetical protein [Streptomyces sp. NPDC002666]
MSRDPELSVVLFHRAGWTHADYTAWSERLLTDQIGYVAPTGWEGQTVCRFAFLNPETSLDTVREILGTTN